MQLMGTGAVVRGNRISGGAAHGHRRRELARRGHREQRARWPGGLRHHAQGIGRRAAARQSRAQQRLRPGIRPRHAQPEHGDRQHHHRAEIQRHRCDRRLADPARQSGAATAGARAQGRRLRARGRRRRCVPSRSSKATTSMPAAATIAADNAAPAAGHGARDDRERRHPAAARSRVERSARSSAGRHLAADDLRDPARHHVAVAGERVRYQFRRGVAGTAGARCDSHRLHACWAARRARASAARC